MLRNKLLAIAISLLIPFFANAKVFLVSVGVSDYPGTADDLRLPVNDAKTITWLYSKNADLQYSQLLNSNATRANIISAMDRVFAKAGTNDIVVFFYSGHGYPGGFYVYDGELSYDAIRKSMAKSKCRNKMIFADSCFSGQMRTDKKTSRTRAAVKAAKSANVMLFLSSRSDEFSIERSDMKNGFFTNYLQKGLRGGADANKDRIITARELFNYVSTNVKNISGDRQHPVMWGKFPNNMTVMKW